MAKSRMTGMCFPSEHAMGRRRSGDIHRLPGRSSSIVASAALSLPINFTTIGRPNAARGGIHSVLVGVGLMSARVLRDGVWSH